MVFAGNILAGLSVLPLMPRFSTPLFMKNSPFPLMSFCCKSTSPVEDVNSVSNANFLNLTCPFPKSASEVPASSDADSGEREYFLVLVGQLVVIKTGGDEVGIKLGDALLLKLGDALLHVLEVDVVNRVLMVRVR